MSLKPSSKKFLQFLVTNQAKITKKDIHPKTCLANIYPPKINHFIHYLLDQTFKNFRYIHTVALMDRTFSNELSMNSKVSHQESF